MLRIYFSDYFEVTPEEVKEYGAFNISLVNDLPLFIDPFLLFNSENNEYRYLHDQIIKYVIFLKSKSTETLSNGLLNSWFFFPEVKQTWFGYSKTGNSGSGLGPKFASALNRNLTYVLKDFGSETISKGSHLEKLCLIRDGVGKDNISDFTTNLIKGHLLNYTQNFALSHIRPELRRKVSVKKVNFNYTTETWESDTFELPYFNNDYVLLTPRNILTKEESWINRSELYDSFDDIANSVPNEQLRAQIDNYFRKILPEDSTQKEYQNAVYSVIEKYPVLLDYYIALKEQNGNKARNVSKEKVAEGETLFFTKVVEFVDKLIKCTDFYDRTGDTYQEAYERVLFLKDVIENKDGYRLFYVKGQPVKREADLQILFRLTWYATNSDVNREVNNGRGPVDYKVSRGNKDKTLVEFKLASNSKLKDNMAKQVDIYKKANNTEKALKVILYFTDDEYNKVFKVLSELDLQNDKSIVLIDANQTNKLSASNVKYQASLF